VVNATGLLTVVFLAMAAGWYCPLILRRRVNPVPATWILGVVAMNVAMFSYHAIPGRTLIENVTLYAAAFEITIVLGVLVVVLWRSSELRVAFDRMQKLCLVFMAAAVGYWALNKEQPNVTFWATQTLLVIAYAMTIAKAIQRRTAFDSIGNWGFIFLASVVGTVPAIAMASPYGLGNSFRAVVSSGLNFFILVYFDRKNEWSRWRDELDTLAKYYKIS
jgi:uncharacterized membrane protein YqgA involved in biofilm formation